MNVTGRNALPLAFLLASTTVACKEAQAKTKGVGDSLRAFIVQNATSGERYCQVCAYSGRPTLMAVTDIEDDGAEKDLAEMQKIFESNKEKGLTVFALFGSIKDGKFTPVKDDAAALKKLKELTAKLELGYPVTIVPSSYTEKEKKGYMPFVDQYVVPKSRTVLLAGADNKIVFADVMDGADQKYEKLATAVTQAM